MEKFFTFFLIIVFLFSCNNGQNEDTNSTRQNDYESTGLSGTYVSKKGYYNKIAFKGKSSVLVTESTLGFEIAASYVIDKNYIRINTQNGDLLFEIINSDTLIGEGFASGTFIKSRTSK